MLEKSGLKLFDTMTHGEGGISFIEKVVEATDSQCSERCCARALISRIASLLSTLLLQLLGPLNFIALCLVVGNWAVFDRMNSQILSPRKSFNVIYIVSSMILFSYNWRII